jgi:hypothetical protein
MSVGMNNLFQTVLQDRAYADASRQAVSETK